VPEDLALIIAGLLVASEHAHLWLMAITCYFGILIGDLIIYRVGWITGPKLFRKKWFKKYLTSTKLQTLRGNLTRRTFFTIFLARHLFYLRTVTFLVCGAVRVPFSRFLIADSIAALVTTPLGIGLGYIFAAHYETLLAWVKQVKLLLAILGILIAVYLVLRFMRQSRSQEEDDGTIEEDARDTEGETTA
jgi:membrane protein DedA with SNARE-associated domain